MEGYKQRLVENQFAFENKVSATDTILYLYKDIYQLVAEAKQVLPLKYFSLHVVNLPSRSKDKQG